MRNLCTEGGSVTVTSVRAAHPTGSMYVVDWGFEERSSDAPATGVGGANGLVTQFPGYTHRVINVPCGSKKRVVDFDVSVAYKHGTRASMEGVKLTYGDGEVAPAQYNVEACLKKCPSD